ncbi:DNA-binding response regulator [Sphingomonas melonis TY]|jgi:two-component system, OmpR family, response regulator|uniref:DNA-binding response regulator n=1 Tax=Sphingomonas melonis TY TaxID=621456 RepID=A0A154NBP1_9SPHN|nr:MULTISPECIES: response regulator transcription factor [Sphingomonas]AOW23576.1 DNA-binding response regulator [Sphingomonas melonis TY]ATI54571.1 DNA-binding response regulator [Sphingomonas melonis]KZB97042.1 DNA-binding response regulator [Sphingomonas melonis TY]MBI0531040.1 DNA-binding response regulator [Sphingomonas sp. TX0522]MBX8844630.1 response regulator transcription factor [Sphingomonas melonis]
MARILLIEDDDGTADEIGLELRSSGHDVTRVAALEPARTLSAGEPFDLLILDRQLPDGEGLELLSDLRRNGQRTPALVLSALGSLDDRVRGLRAGGDDYLPKPFALVELVARVEALLRRPNDTRATRLIAGPLELDLLAGTATRAGRPLGLLPRELKLLDYMVRRAGQIVTRAMLLRDVWGYSFEPDTNVVDVHLGRLRRKIDGEGETPMIRNVRGQGYVLDAPL